MRALIISISVLLGAASAFVFHSIPTSRRNRCQLNPLTMGASKGEKAEKGENKIPKLPKAVRGVAGKKDGTGVSSKKKKKSDDDGPLVDADTSFADDLGMDDMALGDYDLDSLLLPFDKNPATASSLSAPRMGEDELELEEALRSIEDGKFDLDNFLMPVIESDEEFFSASEDPGPEPEIEQVASDSAVGVEAPPLEEFRRLMESLGPDSMFDEDGVFAALGDRVEESAGALETVELEATPEDAVWFPTIYGGGEVPSNQSAEKYFSWAMGIDEPAVWRVQIVAVVTNSSLNSTALDMVRRVYDHIQRGTDNDPRIAYQTICFRHEDGSAVEELDDAVQMWLEGYNTYHLVDGRAMKEAWGAIMPHIMLSEKNLGAILERVIWALHEDEMRGALLTPRQRRIRFRGGAQEMQMGFNTEELESEFSVVSVR